MGSRGASRPRHPGPACAPGAERPPPPTGCHRSSPGTVPQTPPPHSPRRKPAPTYPLPQLALSQEPGPPRPPSTSALAGPAGSPPDPQAMSPPLTSRFVRRPREPASQEGRGSSPCPSRSLTPARGAPSQGSLAAAPPPLAGVQPAGSAGQGAPLTPQQCRPPSPDLLPPPERGARPGSVGSARIAGLGRSGGSAPGSRGHRCSGTRRATRGLAPGPCSGVRGGSLGQLCRPPKCGSARRPGGPSPSRPRGGPAGTRGTVRPETATPRRLWAAREPPAGVRASDEGRGRPRGPAGGGGGIRVPDRAVLTAVGDEQAGQDHERPKS